MKKVVRYIVLTLIIVTSIVQILNIWIVNSVDAQSIIASKLTKQINELREKNSILETEVLKYTSYSNIASRAAKLGFDSKKDFILLGTPQELAVR